MNLKKILFSFLVFYLSGMYGQTPKNIDSVYNIYFQKTREIPHLHLNKTSFLKGENIWFQAYVFNQNSQKLNKPTSNLHVSLFDEMGKLKEQHLIQIKNGIGQGNIKIDSSFTNTAYYLKASTNWMKNFTEDHSFSQKITVLKNREVMKEEVEKDSFFDFQLFPEGGHIVANTYSRIGILLKDANNNGIKIKKGIIKDKNGQVINMFKTNQFGIGEAFLPFKENQTYIFEAITKENTKIEAVTPVVEKYGIGINLINDKNNNNFIVNILTNQKTLKNIDGKKYRIMLHNSRKYINNFIEFNSKKKVYGFKLEKNKIPKGINMLTVFNEENTPILERIFYNDSPKLLANIINTKVVNEQEDSLKVRFTNNHSEKMFLSSSFLPTKTKAYKPENSIVSSVLLKPYTKGVIENPGYYFNDDNKNRLDDLDLLLLTQGWSKYKWDNIFNNPPSENYDFEIGIDVTFKINTKTKYSQQVQMEYIDEEANEYYKVILPFDKNNTFTIQNSFIFKNTVLKFGIKDGENLFKIGPSISYSNNFIYDNINTNQIKELQKTPDVFSNFLFLFDDYILLDNVIIKSKPKVKNRTSNSTSIYRTLSKAFDISNSYNMPLFDGSADSWDIYRDSQIYRWRGVGSYFRYNRNTFSSYTVVEEVVKNPSTIKLPVGFVKVKEYYAPKYPSFKEDTYLNYGAIFWKPSIEIEANSSIEFNIPKNQQSKMLVYIEGVDSDANLLAKEIKL